MKVRALLPLLILSSTISAAQASATETSNLITSDIDRFYNLYDAADGNPSASLLQTYYIDPGSPGLKDFIPNRIVSGEALAKRIAKDRSLYDQARKCLPLLSGLRSSYERSMERFQSLYPEAVPTDVTVVVGRANSGGTVGASGVILGLEVVCKADQPTTHSIPERIAHLAAHEAAHTSQNYEKQPTTLLGKAIQEGSADLVAELISGDIANDHLKLWTKGREAEIERKFRAELDSTDLKEWIYNGVGTPEKPGDLAYWVGYRISKSYYDRAADKPAALKRLLTGTDFHQILAESGWNESAR